MASAEEKFPTTTESTGPVFPLKWERLLRVLEVLGPGVVAVVIFAGSCQLQSTISASDLKVKRVDLIAQMAQSPDGPQTQQAILNLSSTLGAEAIPFLLARLEHYSNEIMKLRKELRLPEIWPLPNEVLSSSCEGDPTYSRVQPLSKDSLSDALFAAQRGWNSTLTAIRLMGTDNFPKLFDAMRNNGNDENLQIYLRALVELRATQLDGMLSYLEAAINNPELGPRSRGDALAVLAYGGADNIKLTKSFNLDLSCRKLPSIAVEGGPSEGGAPVVGQIRMERMHWRGAHISNVSIRGANFYDTRFTRSTLENVQIDGLNATIFQPGSQRTLQMDSTILESVRFEHVNLRSIYVEISLLQDVIITESDMEGGTLVGVWIDGVHLINSVAPRYIQIETVRNFAIRGTHLDPNEFMVRTSSPTESPGGMWRNFQGEGYAGITVDRKSLALIGPSATGADTAQSWLRELCRGRSRDVEDQLVCQ